MSRHQAWDESAFSTLFEEVYPGLARYLECLLGRSGAAQEVAQDAFVRLLRLGTGRIAPDQERFWLYRVATNLARNEMRRRRLRERLGSLLRTTWLQAAAKAEPAIDGIDRRQRLLGALATLPEHHREAFLLREQQELSYKEIATVLGVSESKVKVDVYRARSALRERVAPRGTAHDAGDREQRRV